jgi:hypothetical protein
VKNRKHPESSILNGGRSTDWIRRYIQSQMC